MISCAEVQPSDLYVVKVYTQHKKTEGSTRSQPDSNGLETSMKQDAEVFDTGMRKNSNIISQFLLVGCSPYE